MAIMTDEQRIITYASVLRTLCEDEAIDCTQQAVRDGLLAAVVAIDQWLSDNSASLLASLPEPFASASTLEQKVQVFVYVVMGRFNRSILD